MDVADPPNNELDDVFATFAAEVLPNGFLFGSLIGFPPRPKPPPNPPELEAPEDS